MTSSLHILSGTDQSNNRTLTPAYSTSILRSPGPVKKHWTLIYSHHFMCFIINTLQLALYTHVANKVYTTDLAASYINTGRRSL